MKKCNARPERFGKIILLSVILFLFAQIQSTQARYRFQGGANFMLAYPQGEFKDNMSKTGIGGAFEFVYSPAPIPMAIGVSLGYLQYGKETRPEPFSTTIPDVMVEVSTTNNIMLGHLFLRVQNKKGLFQPYLDGLVGFNYLFTDTKIQNINHPEYGEIASSTNLDDNVFSYGGGGGLMIRIHSGNVYKDSTRTDSEGQRKKYSLLLDFRVRYIKGGEAEYLKKGSIRREEGKVYYDITKSRTDLLTAQVGLIVEF
jgi:hypothetical protein